MYKINEFFMEKNNLSTNKNMNNLENLALSYKKKFNCVLLKW